MMMNPNYIYTLYIHIIIIIVMLSAPFIEIFLPLDRSENASVKIITSFREIFYSKLCGLPIEENRDSSNLFNLKLTCHLHLTRSRKRTVPRQSYKYNLRRSFLD